MGLAAPKNRIKLSHDPNNTKWTKDTQSFGHKLMLSQGWQPGEYLGAKDAPHSEFHTAANASHIRVAIKDDNLGLGAKVGLGVGHGECTGLDAFQNLLGRLNGRDEDEMAQEQKNKEDLKRAIYTEQRWGSIRFVKGGLLVGDKIQPLIDAEAERVRKLAETASSSSSDSSSSVSEEEEPVVKARKSKKRKLEEVEETIPEVVAVKVKKSKKSRKSEATPADAEEVAAAMNEVKLSKKKSKKEKDSKPESEATEDEEQSKQRKKKKKEKKERKREKKEQAEALEAALSKEARKKAKREKRKAEQEDDTGSLGSSRVSTKESTPLAADSSGRSTPMAQGRHAVRARNIAQKRLASMDVTSLNQIFMIKSQT